MAPKFTWLLFFFFCFYLFLQCTPTYGFATSSKNDLYSDLGLKKGASKNEIKQAFRKLTRENHPDLKEAYEEKEKAKEVMARVLRAYETLSDEKKRYDYDKFGVVAGEMPDTDSYTTDEIFEYFHQKQPIFSKSETLDSFVRLQRIKQYRGHKIFLLQAYSDQSSACRTYSSAWEMLFNSALVQSGVLEMYRIDAASPEGAVIAEEAGLKFKDVPVVGMYVDGVLWPLYNVKEVVKSGNRQNTYEHLLAFTMSFFEEYRENTTANAAKTIDDLLNLLRAPRPEEKPWLVFYPKITTETIPIATQMRYNEAVVHVVQRQLLRVFLEEYCEMQINVKDRFGEDVPMPEFVMLSTEPLLGSENFENSKYLERECKSIHIGVSAALSYDKAASFLNEYVTPKHPGMGRLMHLDEVNYWQTCKEKCAILFRTDCGKPLSEMERRLAELMSQNKVINSFHTGYVCLDEHEGADSVFQSIIAESSTRSARDSVDPLLIALKDGTDDEIFLLDSLFGGKGTEQPKELSISDIVNALEFKEGTFSKIVLTTSVAQILFGNLSFPIDTSLRHYNTLNAWLNYLMPSLMSFGPFLIMYFIQKRFMPFQGEDDAAPAPNEGNNNENNGDNGNAEGNN